jgi:3-deoxy-D-manno-octulosonic-acid transferase
MHAASVGEVSAAAAIIASLGRLMPDSAVILSTTTEHGLAFAQKKLGTKATCIFAPVDFIVSVRKALSTLRPDILVCLETEIWPNWLMECYRMGIRTALVNGRISVRSIKGYVRIRPLIKETLKHVRAFSMIREGDAKRIKMIGAPEERIQINGNAKYDLLLQNVDMVKKETMEELFTLKGDDPVFVAGSTRPAEEDIVLDVYEKIIRTVPETLLIIAPRHVQRAEQIKTLIEARGFLYQFGSDLKKGDARTAQVVIIDTMGDLQAIYSIASIVFCGGSLVPLGGQNVLEAAAWGKPVLYGPSMEDFLDAKELLDKTGGGILVKDGRELADKAQYYLKNPDATERIGTLARKALLSNQGAADKHAAVIFRLLQSDQSYST